MARKLNGYYSVSIITLVIMGFIFVYELYMQDWFKNNDSQAYQILKEYAGQYALSNSTSPAIINLKPGLSEGSMRVAVGNMDRFILRVSDFEDEQVLVEIFDLDSLGIPIRRDACEVLLNRESGDHYTGGTLGNFCGYLPGSQSFERLKINLANPFIQVDIETRHAEKDSIIQQSVYVLEREVEK